MDETKVKYGTKKTTTTTDEFGSTITTVDTFQDSELMKRRVQYRIRVKVRDSKQEMAEYLKFNDLLREKRLLNRLITKDADASLLPNLVIEYPKYDEDGSYFIIKSWTELV